MDTKKVIIAVVVILLIAIGAFAFISANSHDTKIELTSNRTLKNGDAMTFVLKDNYRNVYPNQVIDVKILDDSGWATKYNATTDENGQASVIIMALDNGNYTVHSTFNGTLFLSKSKSVNDLEINDGLESY
ncbi:hypothetical protein [Methanobrevibacter sp.]|uniref:hypothetical protein n=1 Tax=Methanobrevibacter sp. TaxID=66852 RepID=UPI0026E05D9D|nr:hypothetical protein [Methanobrevibacter sp.]MDO5859578.1 hypothetical protein [Methanobrevibacter sp.]